MGAVYLAHDQRLRSTVALKETSVSDESLLKAFEREAHLLASLRHPALPKVIDHFVESNGQFLVMEYISGEDFGQKLERTGSPFSPSEVLGWADQLLDALDYLHSNQPPIIHRDIKPQNLKITDRGQVILLDFGLAKGATGQMSKVAGRSIFGYTPHYAPLEQIQGTGTNERSDLYSLAATCYHLMTNVTPPDALARATSVLGGQPDPLQLASQINQGVSVAVAAVLQRSMDLNPVVRPLTAVTMRRLLKDASAGRRNESPETVRHSTVERPAPQLISAPTLPSTLPSAELRKAEPIRTIASESLGVRSAESIMRRKFDAMPPMQKSYRPLTISSLAALGAVITILGLALSFPASTPVLQMIVSLLSLVCFVWVLVRQFQNGGAAHGVAGIITCGLWTLFWGWINVRKLAIGYLMPIWTALLISNIVLNIMSGGFSYSFGTPATP